MPALQFSLYHMRALCLEFSTKLTIISPKKMIPNIPGLAVEMPLNIQKVKFHELVSSISEPPDGMLIMGNDRIPIHKTYLSFYSDFFKTMFQSKFKEGRGDEIELEEVEYGEMLELLSVIYPSAAPITGWP
ncbi:BTB/POZ domain-containing protein [Ditylenchus destructor]|uniref:BTB/POZ domain-containing protein n=1 Tax=Ditylenchus destructor TaxID=166010 RepID=A0AAD4QTS5_9BILA|nr:BTB/POZ domain-containing protein [Ditylenchus destructor]